VTGPDVMGREEVAHHLGGQPPTRLAASARRPVSVPAKNDGARKLARGLIWDAPAIRAYAKDRRRPDPKHTKVLQSFRKTGNIAQAARTAGVHVSTARRVLVDVGLIAAPRD
jgi:hypothetical protein